MALSASAIKDAVKDNYYKFAILMLLFLLLSFDQDLALIYILIMFGDYIWFKSDNFVSFPISRRTGGPSNSTILLESAIGLGIFIVISTVLVSTFSPQSVTGDSILAQTQSIFHLLATSTPILQGNTLLTFIAWGILVPIIETSFFNARLLEGLSSYAEVVIDRKISLEKLTTPLMVVIGIIAALFTLFHLTAKGLSSIPLLITFIFSVISSILVIRHRQSKGAMYVHVATNSLSVSSTLGFI